jgi:hypothetical protein
VVVAQALAGRTDHREKTVSASESEYAAEFASLLTPRLQHTAAQAEVADGVSAVEADVGRGGERPGAT